MSARDRAALVVWLRTELRGRVGFDTLATLVKKYEPAISMADHLAIVRVVWNGQGRARR